MNVSAPAAKLKPNDYASDQEVRWCPGCGDYAILKAVQKTLADLGAERENTVFVSYRFSKEDEGCAEGLTRHLADKGVTSNRPTYLSRPMVMRRWSTSAWRLCSHRRKPQLAQLVPHKVSLKVLPNSVVVLSAPSRTCHPSRYEARSWTPAVTSSR